MSGLDLSVYVERSVTVVAAQVASSLSESPALPENQPAQTPTSTRTSRISSTAVTPGATPSTTAAIPQSLTGNTASTQPSTDATAPASGATIRLVGPALAASQPKSLVQQVLAAFDEARVESEKIRMYLPDFLKKLREELSQEVRGEPGQEASACGLALSETRRGLVIPGLAVAVCALVRD